MQSASFFFKQPYSSRAMSAVCPGQLRLSVWKIAVFLQEAVWVERWCLKQDDEAVLGSKLERDLLKTPGWNRG